MGARLILGLAVVPAAAAWFLAGPPAADRAPRERPRQHARFEAAADRFLDKRGDAGAWIVMANALERSGATADAVSALKAGIDAAPGSADLWVALGNALALHGDGLPPAARLAYARAAALAPASPAPFYFEGLAAVGAGDGARAAERLEAAQARALPGGAMSAEIAILKGEAAALRR